MENLLKHDSAGDSELVELCLRGNREAFGAIVARYQSIICAISYSACGNISRSEDIAQETFLAAWKNLCELKEPAKLKSWLCGIARNLINNSQRKEHRTPTAFAVPLEAELCSLASNPREAAMSKEEERLVWGALETMPAEYREPLVLFYRDSQSTRSLAATLNLSEEAARQRLARGRSMLNARVLKSVESALLRSGPGKAFTLGVLAGIPVLSMSARAASLGVGCASKTATTAGFLGSALTFGIPGFGLWLSYRLNLRTARSEKERRFVTTLYTRAVLLVAMFCGALAAIIFFSIHSKLARPSLITGALLVLIVIFVFALLRLIVWSNRARAKFAAEADANSAYAWEYRSGALWLGLPLLHIRLGDSPAMSKPVTAWIAVGSPAFGGLFAFGSIAVAPVSLGACSVGLVSWGAASLGVFAMGGAALGAWAFGGLAVGWKAFGGCALAWRAAVGGIALGHDFAAGGLARAAAIANGPSARLVESSFFFRAMEALQRNGIWLNLVWILPLLLGWLFSARYRRMKT